MCLSSICNNLHYRKTSPPSSLTQRTGGNQNVNQYVSMEGRTGNVAAGGKNIVQYMFN